MKLSLTLHNKTYSVESDDGYDGSDVYELAEQFKGLLVNAGFHPSNVDSIFNLDYQWFTDEENAGNLQGHNPFADDDSSDPFGRGSDEDDPLKLSAYSKRRAEIEKKNKIDNFQNNMYKNT